MFNDNTKTLYSIVFVLLQKVQTVTTSDIISVPLKFSE